jgi:hypothetical protein
VDPLLLYLPKRKAVERGVRGEEDEDEERKGEETHIGCGCSSGSPLLLLEEARDGRFFNSPSLE